jgi:hypothetical protein
MFPLYSPPFIEVMVVPARAIQSHKEPMGTGNGPAETVDPETVGAESMKQLAKKGVSKLTTHAEVWQIPVLAQQAPTSALGKGSAQSLTLLPVFPLSFCFLRISSILAHSS